LFWQVINKLSVDETINSMGKNFLTLLKHSILADKKKDLMFQRSLVLLFLKGMKFVLVVMYSFRLFEFGQFSG
jgi:hypothetical protein